jgi:hypothetical protein
LSQPQVANRRTGASFHPSKIIRFDASKNSPRARMRWASDCRSAVGSNAAPLIFAMDDIMFIDLIHGRSLGLLFLIYGYGCVLAGFA